MTLEALVLPKTSPLITAGYLMQVFLSLLIVLALIYIASKYLLPKMKFNAAGRIVQVLDRVFLEPQVTAYVLKAGKSAWLVVVSSKQIARIDRIEEESIG